MEESGGVGLLAGCWSGVLACLADEGVEPPACSAPTGTAVGLQSGGWGWARCFPWFWVESGASRRFGFDAGRPNLYIYKKSAFNFLCAQSSCHQRIEPWRQNAFLDLYDRLERCSGLGRCCAVVFRRCRCPPTQSCRPIAYPHAPSGRRCVDADIPRVPLEPRALPAPSGLVGPCGRKGIR